MVALIFIPHLIVASCAYWPCAYLLWRNVSWGPSSAFEWGCFSAAEFFLIVSLNHTSSHPHLFCLFHLHFICCGNGVVAAVEFATVWCRWGHPWGVACQAPLPPCVFWIGLNVWSDLGLVWGSSPPWWRCAGRSGVTRRQVASLLWWSSLEPTNPSGDPKSWEPHPIIASSLLTGMPLPRASSLLTNYSVTLSIGKINGTVSVPLFTSFGWLVGFFGRVCSMRKFRGQGVNAHQSSGWSHGSDHTGSLTHWAIRELPVFEIVCWFPSILYRRLTPHWVVLFFRYSYALSDVCIFAKFRVTNFYC